MAHEPLIEVEGYAFNVKRFHDGGLVIKTCVTPSWFDKQTSLWTDGETMFFDVTVQAVNQRLQAVASEIEHWLQQGESVQVFFAGNLTETKGSQGGAFKRVFPRRFYLIGHKPKGQPHHTGATGAQQASQTTTPANTGDPWASQTTDEYEF